MIKYDKKIVPTEYEGTKFRSCLEAMWAYYFDLLKIKWKYEPRNFPLSNGMSYLPDFYLPQFHLFCEVKPCCTWDDKWLIFINENECIHNQTGKKVGFMTLFGKPHSNCCSLYYKGENETYATLMCGYNSPSLVEDKNGYLSKTKSLQKDLKDYVKMAKEKIYGDEDADAIRIIRNGNKEDRKEKIRMNKMIKRISTGI